MEDLTLFAKALADPTRIRILWMLRGRRLCVCEIGDALGVPQSSLSTHLSCLRTAGLVSVDKDRTWAYYSIEEWAEPLLEGLDRHFGPASDSTLKLDAARLKARLRMREGGCCVVGYGQLIQIGEKRK
jgi:ArsR family transcriptional regulator